MTTVSERETVTKEIHTAVRHSVVYGMGGLLAKAIGFLMLPFYTHFLTPFDYGILEILDLSMSLLGMFLNMGITAALLRSYAAAKSPDEKARVVSTAFLFVVVTAVITYFIMLWFIRPVSIILVGPKVPKTYLLLCFTSFVLGYIAILPRTYLRALEASGAFVGVETVSLLLMLVLNVYLIAVLKLGLLGLLWSALAVIAVQAVVLSWWTLRKVQIRFSAPLLRQMVGFGLPLIFSNVALFALNFSDRFFLQHLRSMETVGIYAVGYKFGFMMSYLLVQPFYAMWQSRMYVIHAQPSYSKIFGQIFVLYSLLLTYAGLALSMLSPEIVRVMVGPKFSSSQEVIPLVTLAYIFSGLGYYAQLGMFLTNRTNLIGMVSAGAAVMNLGLNYFLILHYGMMGAAWATLLSFVVIAGGSYYFSQRVFPLPLDVWRVAKAMILGVSFYFVSRYWSPRSAAVALAMKCALLAGFPVLLWAVRILSQAEVGTLVAAKDRTFAGVSRLVGIVSGRQVSL